MEVLSGKTLIRKNGDEVSSEVAMDHMEIICFYFSAHWCGPCVEFTPILAKVYEESRNMGNHFEIVFVSSDNSEKEMMEYMEECHGNWLAIKHGDSLISELETKFDVDGIPTLVVVRRNGDLITDQGRIDIEDRGIDCIKEWLHPSE